MSDNDRYDEGAQAVAAMTARELAANARDDAPADVEDLDYDEAVLGVDEPCGEGMCRCECPGDPDERPLSECDHCEGGDRCACAFGQGARYDECDCGPTGEEITR